MVVTGTHDVVLVGATVEEVEVVDDVELDVDEGDVVEVVLVGATVVVGPRVGGVAPVATPTPPPTLVRAKTSPPRPAEAAIEIAVRRLVTVDPLVICRPLDTQGLVRSHPDGRERQPRTLTPWRAAQVWRLSACSAARSARSRARRRWPCDRPVARA